MDIQNQIKELPYFLKGGLIGIIITLIYSVIMLIIISSRNLTINDPFFSSYPMMLLMGQYYPSSIIFCLIIYFLLGALIGFIYGTLYKKKEN